MALINTLGEIGNAIREKTGGTDLIPLKEMASAIRSISTGEQESTPNNLYYATKIDSGFQNANFPENYEFVAQFQNLTSIGYAFNLATNLKSIKLINENSSTSISYNNAFALNTVKTPTLETIDLTEFNRKITYMLNAFRYQKKLKSILGELDISGATNILNAFGDCIALEEVRFAKETIKLSISFAQSSKLSANSIQSIIDGLAAGLETTQTLTLSNKVVVTDEQKAVIDDKKCWTLVQ